MTDTTDRHSRAGARVTETAAPGARGGFHERLVPRRGMVAEQAAETLNVSVAFGDVGVEDYSAIAGGRRGLDALLGRAVRATLEAEGIAEAEVCVTLLDDKRIAELNERYLAHDGPTDVLSFPLWSEGEPPVGDVYIGLEQAMRQAGALGVSQAEELVRLAVHGTLHVLGYEHPDGAAREQSAMWELQEQIVMAVVE